MHICFHFSSTESHTSLKFLTPKLFTRNRNRIKLLQNTIKESIAAQLFLFKYHQIFSSSLFLSPNYLANSCSTKWAVSISAAPNTRLPRKVPYRTRRVLLKKTQNAKTSNRRFFCGSLQDAKFISWNKEKL